MIPKVNSTLEVGLLRYHPSTRRATLKETQRALLLYRIKLIVKLIHQDDYPNMLQLMAEPVDHVIINNEQDDDISTETENN